MPRCFTCRPRGVQSCLRSRADRSTTTPLLASGSGTRPLVLLLRCPEPAHLASAPAQARRRWLLPRPTTSSLPRLTIITAGSCRRLRPSRHPTAGRPPSSELFRRHTASQHHPQHLPQVALLEPPLPVMISIVFESQARQALSAASDRATVAAATTATMTGRRALWSTPELPQTRLRLRPPSAGGPFPLPLMRAHSPLTLQAKLPVLTRPPCPKRRLWKQPQQRPLLPRLRMRHAVPVAILPPGAAGAAWMMLMYNRLHRPPRHQQQLDAHHDSAPRTRMGT
jgi:hypothetical protein